jgi:hypothetical protein
LLEHGGPQIDTNLADSTERGIGEQLRVDEELVHRPARLAFAVDGDANTRLQRRQDGAKVIVYLLRDLLAFACRQSAPYEILAAPAAESPAQILVVLVMIRFMGEIR